jgi:hypothetical protein
MDQASSLGSPAGQTEREERQDRGHADRGFARPDQGGRGGQAGRPGREEKALRGFLVRIDGFLIDPVHFSDRVRRGPTGEEDGD